MRAGLTPEPGTHPGRVTERGGKAERGERWRFLYRSARGVFQTLKTSNWYRRTPGRPAPVTDHHENAGQQP